MLFFDDDDAPRRYSGETTSAKNMSSTLMSVDHDSDTKSTYINCESFGEISGP